MAIALIAGVAILSVIALVMNGRGGSELELLKADEHLRQGHLERQRGNHPQQEYSLLKALEIYGAEGDFTKKSSCMVHLVDCYSKQGKLKEAREMSQQLIAYWRSMISKPTDTLLKDFDYFIATADFGGATMDVAEFYSAVPELKKKLYGPVHSEVADSIKLLSLLYARLGEKDKAAQLEAESDEMRAVAGALPAGSGPGRPSIGATGSALTIPYTDTSAGGTSEPVNTDYQAGDIDKVEPVNPDYVAGDIDKLDNIDVDGAQEGGRV